MKYGYRRPLVSDRDIKKQLIDLQVDHLYTEKHGLAKKRIELENLLMLLKPHDHLFVQNCVALADSMQQFLDLLRLAERDQITIHFLDEGINTHSIQHYTLLEGTRFFTTLQSNFLSHSSTFTLQDAKEKGRPIGRPRKSDTNLKRAFEMYDSKTYTLFDIKQETGISKSSLYRYLDERSSTLP